LCNKAVEGVKDKTVTEFSFISLRKKVMLTDKELDKSENEKKVG
jgi:hypothetical protein